MFRNFLDLWYYISLIAAEPGMAGFFLTYAIHEEAGARWEGNCYKYFL
jgi:hypothetical protein